MTDENNKKKLVRETIKDAACLLCSLRDLQILPKKLQVAMRLLLPFVGFVLAVEFLTGAGVVFAQTWLVQNSVA